MKIARVFVLFIIAGSFCLLSFFETDKVLSRIDLVGMFVILTAIEIITQRKP